MSITLETLKQSINDIRSDETNGTVDIDQEGVRAINYIIGKLNNGHDWEKSIEEFTLRYFPLQSRYELPDDFKALISLYPVLNHVDDFHMKSPTIFNRKLITGFPMPMVGVEEGVYTRLLVYYPYSRAQSITWLANSSYDGDGGTWVGSNDATGVSTDNQQFTENNGSVKFNITVAQSGSNAATLTKTLSTAADLTAMRNSTMFVKFDIPKAISNPRAITGFTFRIGTDASNYYESSVTAQCDNTRFTKGINRLAFDLENATTTGSPTITSMAYSMFQVNYGAAMTDLLNLRFGAFYLCNYEPLVVQYYMNRLVYDVSAEVYLSRFDGTDDNDYVLLPDDAETVVQSGASWRLLDQMEQDTRAVTEHAAYMEAFEQVKAHYPSRRKRPESPSLMTGRW